MFFLYQYELHNLDVERMTILADPRHEFRWLNLKNEELHLEELEEKQDEVVDDKQDEVVEDNQDQVAKVTSFNPEFPFPCNECDAKYKKEGFLKNHKMKKHNVKAGGVCEECSQVFPTVAGLDNHMKKHRICSICKTEFASGDELENHRRVHFSCQLCNYDSKNAYNLKRHMEGFHNQKPTQKKSSLASSTV